MSHTPKSDAASRACMGNCYGGDYVETEFARELERQSAELLEALKEYMSAFGQALEANDIKFNLRQEDADAMARAAIAKAEGK